MRNTLLIGKQDIDRLLTMEEALPAVEHAFMLSAQGQAIMPPKVYLDLPEFQGDFRAMPAYIDGMAGCKWVSSYPNNRQHNLRSVLATILLCDPRDSYPVAIMDGTIITDIRTGAAGGIAVKYLARKDATVIGIVGAGRQAETQLAAVKEVLPIIAAVKVYDRDLEIAKRYANKMGAALNVDIDVMDSIASAADCDVLITTTPSRQPIVQRQYIKFGTHINAIGADAQGKQELASDLVSAAKVIVDDIEQASHSGEINVPLAKALITKDHVWGTLGEIIAGVKKGRESEDDITIFDSTGLAIQDIACAKLVFEKARKSNAANFTFY